MPAMALARLVTTAVSAVICCAGLAFDSALPAMVGLGICDRLVLGRMVGLCWTGRLACFEVTGLFDAVDVHGVMKMSATISLE